MLLNKTNIIKLNSRNIKHYESLGYELPKNKNNRVIKGSTIKVNMKDVQINSRIEVNVQCDNCGNKYILRYQDYNKSIHEEGKCYCKKCTITIFHTGENNPFYNKTHTEQSKKKMSKSKKGRYSAENNPNYGKHHAEEVKQKISESRKGKYNGENSPRWNPNLTEEERELQRNTLENAEWIKKVLARDNYTCQCCRQHQDDIVVHHLDGYNWCKEKRYDETNGTTLCESCHKNFHSLYGYGNNTKEQFEEWIGHAVEILKFEGELPTVRKIKDLTTGEIYYNYKECMKKLNVKNHTQIYDVCNKKIKRTKQRRKDGSVHICEFISKTVKGHELEWL